MPCSSSRRRAGAQAPSRPRDDPHRASPALPGELVALIAGLLVFAYLAWDQALWDPRFQAPLHLIAGAAVVAAGMLAWRTLPVPRTGLEIPILALLVTLGLATVTSENPGLSARSLAVSITWALLLPVGLIVVRRRPAIASIAAIIPILGLALSTLVEMVGRRVAWVAADGPGLPPVRLPGESTPFGSVAVAPFVLSACLVLTLLVSSPAVRRGLQAALVAVGLPLTYLSGSRSAWLAFGVAAVVLGIASWRRMGIRIRLPRGPREVGVTVIALLVLALGTAFAAPRLTAVTSVLYREGLWGDTLRAWSANPILGVGPGVMPYARQAAAQPGPSRPSSRIRTTSRSGSSETPASWASRRESSWSRASCGSPARTGRQRRAGASPPRWWWATSPPVSSRISPSSRGSICCSCCWSPSRSRMPAQCAGSHSGRGATSTAGRGCRACRGRCRSLPWCSRRWRSEFPPPSATPRRSCTGSRRTGPGLATGRAQRRSTGPPRRWTRRTPRRPRP